jgi:hypothetical protein
MHYKLFLVVSFLSYTQLQADFSLKNIVSYVMPKIQEEIVNYDNQFDCHGTLEVETINGSITIKAWNQEKIIIEATKKGSAQEVGALTIDAQITEKSASISSKQLPKSGGAIDYVIIVPHTATVKLRSLNGAITVNQMNGPILAITNKGAITINDATANIRAKTTKGAITVSMRSVKPTGSIMLENQDGEISLALPEEVKGNLLARSVHGKVFCDLYLTLKERTTQINQQFWDSIKKEVAGSFGTGGASINLSTNKGTIRIVEYY